MNKRYVLLVFCVWSRLLQLKREVNGILRTDYPANFASQSKCLRQAWAGPYSTGTT
jgi:hypothetical protein